MVIQIGSTLQHSIKRGGGVGVEDPLYQKLAIAILKIMCFSLLQDCTVDYKFYLIYTQTVCAMSYNMCPYIHH